MTDPNKDEIVKMAREAGYRADAKMHDHDYDLFLNFYTLCRAPLIAENEGLKESLESVLSQLKERDAELARVRAREPFGWYSAKEDDFMLDKIRKTHERLNSHTHRIGKYDLALYTTPPRPAAQEPFAWARPDAVDASQDFRFIKIEDFTVPLYATPTSAVPVVRKMVVALKDAQRTFSPAIHVGVSSAIAAGQKFIKENGK